MKVCVVPPYFSLAERGRAPQPGRVVGDKPDLGLRMQIEKEELLERPESVTTLRDEARLFVRLALPSVLIQVFTFLLWIENSIVVGQKLGTTELASVALGNLTG